MGVPGIDAEQRRRGTSSHPQGQWSVERAVRQIVLRCGDRDHVGTDDRRFSRDDPQLPVHRQTWRKRLGIEAVQRPDLIDGNPVGEGGGHLDGDIQGAGKRRTAGARHGVDRSQNYDRMRGPANDPSRHRPASRLVGTAQRRGAQDPEIETQPRGKPIETAVNAGRKRLEKAREAGRTFRHAQRDWRLSSTSPLPQPVDPQQRTQATIARSGDRPLHPLAAFDGRSLPAADVRPAQTRSVQSVPSRRSACLW